MMLCDIISYAPINVKPQAPPVGERVGDRVRIWLWAHARGVGDYKFKFHVYARQEWTCALQDKRREFFDLRRVGHLTSRSALGVEFFIFHGIKSPPHPHLLPTWGTWGLTLIAALLSDVIHHLLFSRGCHSALLSLYCPQLWQASESHNTYSHTIAWNWNGTTATNTTGIIVPVCMCQSCLGMSIARAHPWAGYRIPVHDDVEPTGHFLGTIKCVLFQNFKSWTTVGLRRGQGRGN